jgi:crotonobetainyl-CoA:carnitine CoA-transferase CaiB-like acyl-CoA transferase
VVDAAIVDGAAHLASTFFGMIAGGIWNPERGTNISDSGSHFYDCYECSDGRWVAVGPIEEKFFEQLIAKLGLDAAALGPQMSRAHWPEAKRTLAAHFRTRTRDDWMALLEASDCCVSPVLSFAEAPQHPHLRARGTFVEVDGLQQPAPAPRFSRTPAATPTPPRATTPEGTVSALAHWLGSSRAAALRQQGIFD